MVSVLAYPLFILHKHISKGCDKMMNYIWSGMLIAGLVFSYFTGNPSGFTDGLMESSEEAVTFMISLAGVMAAWSGIMEIASKSGLVDRLSFLVMPFIRLLFPKEKDKDTIAMILMSFTANIFGAGNSATVFALKTMERLDASNRRSIYASNAMCMFTAVSMSMLQLVPVNIIMFRKELGSEDPGIIIIPSIVAALVSMFVSIAVCRFFEKRSPRY